MKEIVTLLIFGIGLVFVFLMLGRTTVNDVFFLPCVVGIMKMDSDEPFLVLRDGMSDGSHYAGIGDWLVEEDGKWHVEEGGEE